MQNGLLLQFLCSAYFKESYLHWIKLITIICTKFWLSKSYFFKLKYQPRERDKLKDKKYINPTLLLLLLFFPLNGNPCCDCYYYCYQLCWPLATSSPPPQALATTPPNSSNIKHHLRLLVSKLKVSEILNLSWYIFEFYWLVKLCILFIWTKWWLVCIFYWV